MLQNAASLTRVSSVAKLPYCLLHQRILAASMGWIPLDWETMPSMQIDYEPLECNQCQRDKQVTGCECGHYS